MVIDPLDHLIQQVQIIIIKTNFAPIILHDAVVLSIVKIWEMGREANVYAHEGLSCLTQSINEKIDGLNFISCNIMSKGMIGFFYLEIKIFIAMDLRQATIFHKSGWKVPRDGGGSYKKGIVILWQKIVDGGDSGIRTDAESFTVKKIVVPAEQ